MTLQDGVTIAALIMSALCFAIFLIQSLRVGPAEPAVPAKQLATRAHGLTPVSVGEMTDLVKALAALTDSLGKVGPALTSLIGAVLFMMIAAVGSGALVGKPPAPATQNGRSGAPATGASASATPSTDASSTVPPTEAGGLPGSTGTSQDQH